MRRRSAALLLAQIIAAGVIGSLPFIDIAYRKGQVRELLATVPSLDRMTLRMENASYVAIPSFAAWKWYYFAMYENFRGIPAFMYPTYICNARSVAIRFWYVDGQWRTSNRSARHLR